GEAAPAASDVEQGLAGAQLELATDEVELVLLGPLELAVGVAVVGARVDHERIEKEGVEVVRDIVMVGDRSRVLTVRPHGATSPIPKITSASPEIHEEPEPVAHGGADLFDRVGDLHGREE